MYKTILSLSCIALILVVGTFYFKYRSSPQKELAVTTSLPILLYPESGEVTFKILGSTSFQIATSSPTIIPNQTIVHTETGKASVLLPDNSMISLDTNTEITINYSSSKTSVYQTLGTTYHRVQTLLTGSSYQVQTPGTLAAVRGTKFAIKYDSKTKKTKVAVTEHNVEVSTIPPGSQITGTTTPFTETISLGEGKTVTVAMVTKVPKQGESAMQIADTVKDDDMRIWVEVNKNDDRRLDDIKKNIKSDEDIRVEIKKEIFKDIKEDVQSEVLDTRKDSIETNIVDKKVNLDSTKTEIKTEPKPIVETKPTIETKTETTVKTDTTSNTPVTTSSLVKKMDEEQYFNGFNDMFIKYFYLDENDTPCITSILPQERVRQVTSFANTNGYPFTSTTLLSFAQAIQGYCTNKDVATKIKLQARFDEEFPYKDNF